MTLFKTLVGFLSIFLGEINTMKQKNLIALVLAGALLASCGTQSSSSSESSSSEEPVSSSKAEESSSSSAAEVSSESSSSAEESSSSDETPSSSEESSFSSEESSSSSEEQSSSSEESSSSSSTPEVTASWKNITESAASAITTFFEAVDPTGTTHDPDDYLPFFETDEECEWYYDGVYNYAHGYGLGLVCKTGTDANYNKGLIASYNALLEEKGLVYATSDEIEEYYYDYFAVFYGSNVWKYETDFDITITIEILTVAEATEIGTDGNDYDATVVHDELNDEVTDNNGVYFLIQSCQ